MASANPYFLPVADEALDNGYVELLRAGLADKPLFVSLRRHAFDTPDQWGRVLAEITLNLATLYAADGKLGEDAVIDAVTEGYEAWLRKYLASAGTKPKATAKGTAKVPAASPAKPPTKAKASAPARPKARTKPASKPAKLAATRAGKVAAGRKGARKS